jgi:hypothetical protein
MLVFKLGFLHISKDVLYDFNNLVSSSLYQISTTTSQWHQWVVNSGRYHIIGNSLIHNSQDTIFTPRIASCLVKIVKEEHKVLNTLLQCWNTLASFVFIELSNSSLCDNLTPLPFSMKSLIVIS